MSAVSIQNIPARNIPATSVAQASDLFPGFSFDPLLLDVFQAADTKETARRGVPLPLVSNLPALGSLLGMLSGSGGEFLHMQITGRVDDRVGLRHLQLADVALSQAGFTDVREGWSKRQRSSFILGAAKVGEMLQANEIKPASANVYLHALAQYVGSPR